MLVCALLCACDDDTAADLPDALSADARAADGSVDAATGDDGAAVEPDAGTPAPLLAVPGAHQAVDVGATVTLDGSASTGAARYAWDFGDGRGEEGAVVSVTYDAAGRYRATLTVFDAAGRRHSATALVTVTHPPVWDQHARSSTIAPLADGTMAVVSPDTGEVVVVDAERVVARHAVCRGPRTLTVRGDRIAVACPGDDAVVVIADETTWTPLPYGARPYGVVFGDEALYVSLQGTGELARIEAAAVTHRWPVVDDARGVARAPDDRILVTRWRSPPREARLAAVGDLPADPVAEPWTLAFDDQLASDTEVGGVPSYLDQVAISPTGREAALPSLQANVGQGLFRNGEALTHDTTLRAVVSFIDPRTGEERFELRKQFDNRGLASAAVYTSRGDYLYVAMRGSRAIDRLDRLDGTQSGTILDVGFAVDGLALSADDRLLYANASLSREVVVYDVSDFRALPRPLARIRYVEEADEPLPPEVLRGRQLFNDSFDTRVARDGYIACAHCHLDGESDNRVWDFTDRGEGLRNTISLVGRAGAGHGPIHWSGNFDEVQDFEHDIRGPFRGTGLMDDADFHAEGRDQTLGGAKAGVSADLDALAAYVTSLGAWPRSPHRTPEGGLTEAALRGRAHLFDAGCLECHLGPALTDSAFEAPGAPLLHDVGTLGEGSGERLGGPLAGIDTPTLHGLWDGAPYLHDGSAATLHEVLARAGDAHGDVTGLGAREIDELVEYLLSLDGPEGQ